MIINEFRFLCPNEIFFNQRYKNWSRCYEWGYVFGLAHFCKFKTAHNTCCGTNALHNLFASDLVSLIPHVLNTDIFPSDNGVVFDNHKIHSVIDPYNDRFDLVVCISTLEELPPQEIETVLKNLLDQVNPGGRLIITCDYPQVNIPVLEAFTGVPITDVSVRLNGSNSIYANDGYQNLNIILIDITNG